MSATQRRLLTPVGLMAVLGLLTALAGDPRIFAFAVPAPPTALAAVVSGSTVALTWQSGGGSGHTYWLEAGSAPGQRDLGAWPTIVPSLTATGVPAGRYWVRVRASGADGVSGPSNELDVRVGCGAALTAPGTFVGNVLGSAVTLSWAPVPGATAYVLDAGSAPGAADLGRIPVAATTLSANVPAGVYYVRVRALSPCGVGDASPEVVLRVGVVPPPNTTPIYGTVDASTLGTCSAAAHDRWVVDGGDGVWYRTWHPQVDPAGCIYAHEHGDDPARSGHAAISASPVRTSGGGWTTRRCTKGSRSSSPIPAM